MRSTPSVGGFRNPFVARPQVSPQARSCIIITKVVAGTLLAATAAAIIVLALTFFGVGGLAGLSFALCLKICVPIIGVTILRSSGTWIAKLIRNKAINAHHNTFELKIKKRLKTIIEICETILCIMNPWCFPTYLKLKNA